MINLITAIATGAIIGLIYFGGLWLTVRQVIGRQQGAALVTMSWLARIMLFGAAFYALGNRNTVQALAGFGGFWIARFYLLYRLGGRSDGK